MNITATLLAQIVAFALLIWFVNKFLWGPVSAMMAERQKRISDGLAASEKGKHELEVAEKKAKDALQEAKGKAGDILAQAEKRANAIVEEAKLNAKVEADRIVTAAKSEIELEVNRAREQLRTQVAGLAVAGAGRILEKEIDPRAHDQLLNRLVAEI